ncbi:MAG: ribonuclease Y, partial [Elusimicrobia bacterium]|nr:ribonuclease Y [Elusimicrobiota bacterium]
MYGSTTFLVMLVSGFVISFILGFLLRMIYAKIAAKSAERLVKNILNEAKLLGETKQKEMILEAKETIDKDRKEFDKELKEKKIEAQNAEKRIINREENLDRKMDGLDKKEREVSQKEKDIAVKKSELDVKFVEVEKIKDEQKKALERVSGLTREEAKQTLMQAMEAEARQQAAVVANRIELEAKENADKRAKEIISVAIQRVAAEHTTDITTSTVHIPNDEVKGRIIGREGRNIRAFEQVTGVDLIVDDTPEAITVSAFDGVRREIAKRALERLIADGRIHPARIEEVVAKVKKEMDEIIKQTGEQAAIESGVPGLHPEIVKLLGKLKYRTSYGQNQLQHTLEVTWLAGAIGGELGLDVAFCKKAALLHDVGKAVDHEVEGTHHQISADIAKKYGESAKMINAIISHHEGFEEPKSAEAFVIAAADAISAARPGARRESVENYLKRLEKLEKLAKDFKG